MPVAMNRCGDGRELFYLGPDSMVRSVAIERARQSELVAGPPIALNIPPFRRPHFGTQYDVTPDGRCFFFLQANDAAPPRELQVVLNWSTLLQ